MDQEFPYVMIDCETTGTRPDHNAMIQLSAVAFNLEERTVCPTVFDRCMFVPPHRFWSEDTRGWWGGRMHILKGIMGRAEAGDVVMREFQSWIKDRGCTEMVAKPSHFDYPFVESMFKDYGITNPLHYRRVIDMNSWIRSSYFPNPVAEVEVEFTGDAHNALYDCFHQIKVMFAHEDIRNGKTQISG